MSDEREMEFAPLPKSYVKEDFCSNCGQLHEAYSLSAENERLKKSLAKARGALTSFLFAITEQANPADLNEAEKEAHEALAQIESVDKS